tara:strand:+ start:2388 stop:3002 length:615 start_codon:yes stop_codon:yes gene_type:complete
MAVIGYIRVSTDRQDLEKQRHLLLEYSQKEKIVIDNFIEAEISSTKSKKERKIDLIMQTLLSGDTLLVAEISRLGRNMLDTLNIIEGLTNKGVNIIFIRQPELSATGTQKKLLLAIFSYFAEAEREYISMRTRDGLAAAKAKGKQLGRPKGSRDKKGRILDAHIGEIKELLRHELPIQSIRKIINARLDKPLAYNSYWHFVKTI